MPTPHERFIADCLKGKLKDDHEFRRAYIENASNLHTLVPVLDTAPTDKFLQEKLSGIFEGATAVELVSYENIHYRYVSFVRPYLEKLMDGETSLGEISFLYEHAQNEGTKSLLLSHGARLLSLKDVAQKTGKVTTIQIPTFSFRNQEIEE